MKRVLYISYDGLTDPLGQSQVLPYLQNLTKEGYHFTILSFEKKIRYQQEGAVIKSIVERAGITWVPLFFTARPPVLSKIWDRRQMERTAFALHRRKPFHLVHCRSYVSAETGLKMKARFGIPMIFDMRGFWADEKVDSGQWNLKMLLYKSIYNHYKKKETQFLLGSDGIVSLTEAAKQYLLKQEKYNSLSITVIPTCADLDHFNYHNIDESQREKLREELGFRKGDKVMVYLGSVGGWYLTKEMFRFFLALHQKDAAYKMLVLTKDDATKVKEEALQAGLSPDCIAVTYSTRQNLPLFLSQATCAIFFIRNSFSKMASSPTKLAELLGMGIPVICNDIGDTGGIINRTKTGIVVDNFDAVSIQHALNSFSIIEGADKSAIRQSAKEYFDLETGVKRYLDLYRQVLKKDG